MADKPSYSYKEPKPQPKSTFSKLADEFKQTVKPKQEEVKVKKPEKCPCCVAKCRCCFHLSGTAITDHTCKCRCHYVEPKIK